MNSPVAPLSTRELMALLSEVSVVSSSTFNFRDLDSPVAEIWYFSGNGLSHLGFRFFGVSGEGSKVFSGVCTSGKSASESFIFDKISKRLQVDNGGVLFTCCLVQNPLRIQWFLSEPETALLLVPYPFSPSVPSRVPLSSWLGCQS